MSSSHDFKFIGSTRLYFERLGYVDPDQVVTVDDDTAKRLRQDKRWEEIETTDHAASLADEEEAN